MFSHHGYAYISSVNKLLYQCIRDRHKNLIKINKYNLHVPSSCFFLAPNTVYKAAIQKYNYVCKKAKVITRAWRNSCLVTSNMNSSLFEPVKALGQKFMLPAIGLYKNKECS